MPKTFNSGTDIRLKYHRILPSAQIQQSHKIPTGGVKQSEGDITAYDLSRAYTGTSQVAISC